MLKIYIHCIKADVNVKLSNNTISPVVYPTSIPAKISDAAFRVFRFRDVGSAEANQSRNYFRIIPTHGPRYFNVMDTQTDELPLQYRSPDTIAL